MAEEPQAEVGVLRSKRNATRYQILVEVADRQPAVSQQEIADAIGVTAQAVSEYLRELVDQEYVEKHGRGRYEVTKEGVDWLITQTDALRGLVDHVAEDIVGQVEVETALAQPLGGPKRQRPLGLVLPRFPLVAVFDDSRVEQSFQPVSVRIPR